LPRAWRLNERVNDPQKMWKHNAGDFREVQRREDYFRAYEDVFERCTVAPWHVIPADQNWYKSYCAAKILRDALAGLTMEYPGLKKEDAEEID
jgi:polyphosphate kinase 2 (PPK2 family)